MCDSIINFPTLTENFWVKLIERLLGMQMGTSRTNLRLD